MTAKELFDIAERVKQQATPEEIKEFKHQKRREDRKALVIKKKKKMGV